MFYQKFIEIDMNFSDLLRVRDSLFNMFLAFVVTNWFLLESVQQALQSLPPDRPTDIICTRKRSKSVTLQ